MLDLVMPHWAAHHCVGTLSPLRDSTDTCEKATSPESSPTHLKAGVCVCVCAIMPMWLAHIKEHVWTVGICPTTILLPTRCNCVHKVWLCVCKCATLKAEKDKKGTASYEMADMYVPQEVDLGGGGSPSIPRMTQKIVRPELEWTSYCNKFVKCTTKFTINS